MVGTPAETVTRSDAISATRRSGVMNRCGITCLQPSMSADHGKPQPMAWNMGTMPSRVSVADSPMLSVMHCAMVCRYCDRCSYSTPLGFPVVPLV